MSAPLTMLEYFADLISGAFVDSLVADAIGGALLELVERLRASVAEYSFTGTDTSPKDSIPDQISPRHTAPFAASAAFCVCGTTGITGRPPEPRSKLAAG